MANALKEACATAVAGARVVKEGVKFVGRNANKGISAVLFHTTQGLDKLANKLSEKPVVEKAKKVEVQK